MEGTQELVSNLQQSLLETSSNKLVVINGAAGSGKTHLVRQVTALESIKTLFEDHIYWVSVGRTPDVESLQLELLRKITQDEGHQMVSRNKLMNSLIRRRSLLVLDNVWQPEVVHLFDVVPSNGSKILITSREDQLLNEDSSGRTVLEVPPLADEQAMELFCSRSDLSENDLSEERLHAIREMVRECSGNPLVLKVVGAAMVEATHSTFKGALQGVEGDNSKLFRLLRLGFDALRDEKHQDAFLYFAAFPENLPVSKEELMKCWRGEGINEANSFLNRLQKLELIDFDPRTGLFMLPNLLREMIELHHGESFLQPGKNLDNVEAITLTKNHRIISLVRNNLRSIQGTATPCSAPDTRAILLDENPLKSIHNSFFSAFINLRVLSLKGTSITHLPSSVFRLKRLVSLDISHSRIRVVSEALENLSSLEFFDLRHCPHLKSFPVYRLRKLTRLLYFNTEGSPGVWTSSKVDWFNRNPGTTLQISPLVHLRELQIDSNMRVGFPSTIGGLAHLKLLHVYSTEAIRKLPRKFLSLTGLRDLRLSPLEQNVLPDGFCSSLVNLEVLWLGFSGTLVQLPAGIQSLKHLRDVKLKRCSVRILPEAFNQQGAFQRLEEMELHSFTRLSKMPSLEHLQALRTLTLTSCTFRYLPDSFTTFSRLKEMHLLSCVSLGELPSLDALPQLSYLSLSGCCFDHLPPSFGLQGSFPSLETLSVSDCLHLSAIPEIQPGAMAALKSLTLRSCGMKSIPVSIGFFTLLERLSLKKCTGLTSLPSLADLKNLRHLDLSHLEITELPETLAWLPRLEELELEGCKLLSELPLADNGETYTRLEHLSIVNSGIKLPEELRDRPGLNIY